MLISSLSQSSLANQPITLMLRFCTAQQASQLYCSRRIVVSYSIDIHNSLHNHCINRHLRHKFATMSWMDSWSRPSKSQATPAPYYLLPGGENTLYCHSCGRVIGERKTKHAAATAKSEAKYCSARCRHQKPGKLDREIESAFVRLLSGQEGMAQAPEAGKAKKDKKGAKKVKGDQRILVPCSAVEELVFGRKNADDGGATDGDTHSERSGTPEPETEHEEHRATLGRDGDDPTPVEVAEGTVGSDEKKFVDGDVLARMSIRSGTRIRPPQNISEVNGSVGGEKGWKERIEEDEEMLEKRRQGQRRAKEKEMVKCAARRGVVFGFKVGDGDSGEMEKGIVERRLCEAVMNLKVVEPSFAKGDWSIRWRE